MGEGRGPHNGQTWRGTERETNTDLATDKKTLEDLEIAEKKRERQTGMQLETELWRHRDMEETQRQGNTFINLSANFLKYLLCARHCSAY